MASNAAQQALRHEVLDALGCETRRTILHLLEARPRPVGEIAAELPVSRPAVSKHLRILEHAKLVGFERQGQRNVYRLEPSGFALAREWLDEFWQLALTRMAELAEAEDVDG